MRGRRGRPVQAEAQNIGEQVGVTGEECVEIFDRPVPEPAVQEEGRCSPLQLLGKLVRLSHGLPRACEGLRVRCSTRENSRKDRSRGTPHHSTTSRGHAARNRRSPAPLALGIAIRIALTYGGRGWHRCGVEPRRTRFAKCSGAREHMAGYRAVVIKWR